MIESIEHREPSPVFPRLCSRQDTDPASFFLLFREIGIKPVWYPRSVEISYAPAAKPLIAGMIRERYGKAIGQLDIKEIHRKLPGRIVIKRRMRRIDAVEKAS